MGHAKSIKPVSDYVYELSTENRAFNWDKILLDAGYFKVELNSTNNWKSIHTWCQKNIPSSDYVWVGLNFYFTCHKDAIVFALKWI
jgi:hypothetical protein